MKKINFLFFLMFAMQMGIIAQVAVNQDGNNPDQSSMLDVQSADKGILIPRMTTIQRNVISTPAQGLMVYDTDDSTFYYYKNSSWTKIGNGASGWDTRGKLIYADSLSSVVIGTDSTSAVFEVTTEKATNNYTTDVCNGGIATASESASGKPASNAFDNSTATYWSNEGNLSVWISYDFGSGNEKVIQKYKIYYEGGNYDASPSHWTFNASNDHTTWLTLDTQSGITWVSNSWKEFVISNLNRYRYYKLLITNNQGTTDNYVYINEMEMEEMIYSDNPTLFIKDNKVGVGTRYPLATLTVNGSFNLTDGNQATGKILSSDASGNATWVDGITVNGGGWTVNGNYIFNSSDSVGIGISTPHAPLEVHGRISQTGTGNSVFFGEGAGINDNLNYNNNTFVGYRSGNLTSSGYGNSAVGYLALMSSTTGCYNVAFGDNALGSSTNAWDNTAIGSGALQYNTTGRYNVAIGLDALYKNVTGSCNVAVGLEALDSTNANNNTALGYYAGYSNKTGNNNVFLGYQSGYFETGSNKLYIANSNTTTPLIGGDFSASRVDINGTLKITGGSPGSGRILSSDAYGNATWVNGATVNGGGWTINGNYIFNNSDSVGIGTSTPNAPLEVHGLISQTGTGNSVFLGEEAGKNDDLSDNSNVFIGYKAGYNNSTGNKNIANGYESLFSNTTGMYNIANGYLALYNNTTGHSNIANGYLALYSNTTGGYNIATGTAALYSNTTGNSNTANGFQALYSNTSGLENTAIGYSSLYSDTTGTANTAIGYYAGFQNMNGWGNVLIGYKAGYYETESNKLYISNSNTTTPLIGGDFLGGYVNINGDLSIINNSGAAQANLDGSSGNNELQFRLSGSYKGAVGYDNINDYLYLYQGGTVAVKNGNLGIGTASPGYRLQVGVSGDGSIAIANSWNTFSDRRLKKNILKINNPMDKLKQLNGYYYYWKAGSDTSRQVGVIAQEVQKVIPEIVSSDENGILSVNYSKLTPLLIETVKQLNGEIEQLKQEIKQLKKENNQR